MAWVYLFGLGLVLWGACGAVMTSARRIWSLDTALRVHLAAAPIIAFVASAIHKSLVGDFKLIAACYGADRTSHRSRRYCSRYNFRAQLRNVSELRGHLDTLCIDLHREPRGGNSGSGLGVRHLQTYRYTALSDAIGRNQTCIYLIQ